MAMHLCGKAPMREPSTSNWRVLWWPKR